MLWFEWSHTGPALNRSSCAHTLTHTNAQEWVFSTFQMRVYHGAVGSVGSAEDIQSHNTTQHRDYPSLSIFQQTTCCVCVSVCVWQRCLADKPINAVKVFARLLSNTSAGAHWFSPAGWSTKRNPWFNFSAFAVPVSCIMTCVLGTIFCLKLTM